MTGNLLDFKALTFDCYGTLIDWETGIWDSLQPLFLANDVRNADRRATLAAFGQAELDEQTRNSGNPYTEILSATHESLAGQLGLKTTATLNQDFGASVPAWPAFADSANALRYLQTRFKLVILSNVHENGISASVEKLGVRFDAVYTAEAIGSYKPSNHNFRYLLHRLDQDFGIEKPDVLHAAQSLLHDHVPANRFDIANAWIDRQRLLDTGESGAIADVGEIPEYRFRFTTLQALADRVRREAGD